MRVDKFELVDSIFDLNITKFNSFNKFYMVYAEVGGDFADYDTHHVKLNQLVSKDMKHEALIQMSNMRQCVFNNFEGYRPEVEAFKQLVKQENVKDEDLDHLSISIIRESIEEVKKNSLMK